MSLFKRVDILLVASGGGHLVQMRRLIPSFATGDVRLVTTAAKDQVPPNFAGPIYHVADANRQAPLRIVILFLQSLSLSLRLRPRHIISTGAAPGAIFIWICRYLCGSKCIWVDSLANVERMSLSGRLVKPQCDLWLSQWEDVALKSGATYRGQVI